MNDVSRYQVQGIFAESGQVRTHQGVDPLTGLPVLVYRFPGRPTLGIGELESENIPGVLASAFDGKEGQVVAAFARGYRPAGAPLPEDDLMPVLLGSARALFDAAQVGAVHGDIHPGRFLVDDGHVLLEGYGVRWDEASRDFRPPEFTGEGSYAGDVYSWARSLKHLLGGRVPSELRALLESCLSPRPEARPTAREVYEALLAFESGSSSQKPVLRSGAEADVFATLVAAEPPASADSPVRGGRVAKPSLPQSPGQDEEPPRLLTRRSERRAESSDPGFIKDLPPGAKYREGESFEALPAGTYREQDDMGFEPPPQNSRRLFLLLVLLVCAAALGVLAFWQQGASSLIPPPRGPETVYIVDVSALPSDVRYVAVTVVSSPAGSERRAGDVLGTLTLEDPPDPITLDQDGVWRLRGRAQDRLSQVVTISVPQERSIVFEFPAVSGATQP